MTVSSIFTVGHSGSSFDHVLSLLERHDVRTVIDIRSKPYSQRVPHFNREQLHTRLDGHGIKYVFRGDTLGGHPEDGSFYLADGRVNFDLVEQEEDFQIGLGTLVTGELGAAQALFCSEAEPLACPRFFLLGRLLSARGVPALHIKHADGAVETHVEAESRMLVETGEDAVDLFSSHDDKLSRAYAKLKRAYKHRGP